MIGYIYIILVVSSFFSFFRKKKFWKRTYWSIIFSVILTSIICSIISLNTTPIESGVEFKFYEAEITDSKKSLKTAGSTYYIEDSLVYRDTITGITKKCMRREVPQVGGFWTIGCDIDKITKYHMTDEVYKSWKANTEK